MTKAFIPEIETRVYASAPYHFALAEGARSKSGPNIGTKGENLTIAFLSLNRSSLSLKLCFSIAETMPDFAGEILIVDNGSEPEELAALTAGLEDFPLPFRIERLERNFGVAGGRNRTMAAARTDWVMCLDNDIYFVADPRARLQRDLAELGCNFMSLPLLEPDGTSLFALGGHLYAGLQPDGAASLGGGSVYKQSARGPFNDPSFLGTFLFGGSCILHRHSFTRHGGYDEAMFIGFEDIEFSLRLFREGLKVGCFGQAFLIHDHPKPGTNTDANYERMRFSTDIIRQSALYFEEKYNFTIWNPSVERWLDERKRDLELTNSQDADRKKSHTRVERSAPNPVARDKPRIALAVDVPHWAFANIARQLTRNLSRRFSFDLIAMDELVALQSKRFADPGADRRLAIGRGPAMGIVLANSAKYDLIHVFWREDLLLIGTEHIAAYAKFLNMTSGAFERQFVRNARITTSVYDHLFSTHEDLRRRTHIYNELTRGYTVSSARLDGIYRQFPDIRPPSAIVADGVDLEMFGPDRLDRFQSLARREIVVGWAGNSRWGAHNGDPKGVHTILKPAIEQLREAGVPVRLQLADRQDKLIPHEQMRDFYNGIDVYACTSDIEGTPNPVLEAMACGVPVISTDVGVVPEVFGALQRPFILESRTVESLKNALLRLIDDKSIFGKLSAENLTSIEQWDWAAQAEKFGAFFDRMLAS
jgi:glycosyltransferase involved in cell wall biosynthesis/GT2 family glycosyltransferase